MANSLKSPPKAEYFISFGQTNPDTRDTIIAKVYASSLEKALNQVLGVLLKIGWDGLKRAWEGEPEESDDPN